ncbi:MAG: SURF1 family protein, partial [Burkholderiales bacterium]
MAGGLRFGNRRFRPGLVPSIAAAVFIALAVSLGNWQTRRAEEKLELARALDEAGRGAVLSVPSAPAGAAGFARHRVSVRGRFVARATLFLDNQVLHGAAGYHVLTPMNIEGGGMHVLIDRGWIAAGDRSRLPVVPTPEGVQTVEGIAAVPSGRFIELAPDTGTGSLRQNLVLEREEKRLGLSLQPFVVEQTSDAKDGLARVWERPDTGVERHRSYALQWYSLALLAAILYVV